MPSATPRLLASLLTVRGGANLPGVPTTNRIEDAVCDCLSLLATTRMRGADGENPERASPSDAAPRWVPAEREREENGREA
jgi:hypothetical protein